MKLPSFPSFNGENTKEDDFNPFPDLPPKSIPKKFKTEYIILSLSLLIFLSTLGIYLSSNKSLFGPNLSSETSPQAQAAPTPKPLPTGIQVYNYSHGKNVVGPKPTLAIIDPIDPKLGGTQSLRITVPHDKEVLSTTASLITDNQVTPIKLENIETDIWSASWKMNDSYNFNYQIKFEFSDNTETFKGALTFR
jgi:hypothetical protein